YARNEIDSIRFSPMFEKIKEGEWWRLATPIFLHANILHLVFNVLCLLVLGKEMERMLGIGKLALFILITAVFSDTAQYLMTGFRFMGISGVICAMLAFIAVRQKVAPWEGYRLEKSSLNFMLLFIFGMAALSVLSFIAAIAGYKFIGTPIANAAHLAGLFSGWILAYTSLFQWKG
ncbi:MAG: rhomboid family intramembrane serine protease, partial [Parachlamydiaceae bacterium]